MIGLKEGSFLGYAVADLGKGVTTVYRGGHISFRVDAARGGIITPRGDALVYDEKGAHLVPGGDFTRPSLFVTPSRYVTTRSGFVPSMGFATDPSGPWFGSNRIPMGAGSGTMREDGFDPGTTGLGRHGWIFSISTPARLS